MKIKNIESKQAFGNSTYKKIAKLTQTPVEQIVEVMKKEQKFLLNKNESVIIPKGVTKRRKIAKFFLEAYKKSL